MLGVNYKVDKINGRNNFYLRKVKYKDVSLDLVVNIYDTTFLSAYKLLELWTQIFRHQGHRSRKGIMQSLILQQSSLLLEQEYKSCLWENGRTRYRIIDRNLISKYLLCIFVFACACLFIGKSLHRIRIGCYYINSHVFLSSTVLDVEKVVLQKSHRMTWHLPKKKWK